VTIRAAADEELNVYDHSFDIPEPCPSWAVIRSLLGSTLSLALIVAFGFLLSQSVAHLPSKAASTGEAIAWKGTLTDAFARPVRSAEIHLIGGHGELVARTAIDGSFAFSECPSGNYEVAVVLGGREVGYLKALHLTAISSPSRLILASGGRLLVSQHAR
jgi:hypothetical protein